MSQKFSVQCMSEMLHQECDYSSCECICHKWNYLRNPAAPSAPETAASEPSGNPDGIICPKHRIEMRWYNEHWCCQSCASELAAPPPPSPTQQARELARSVIIKNYGLPERWTEWQEERYRQIENDIAALLTKLEQDARADERNKIQGHNCSPASCRDEMIWRESIADARERALREAAEIADDEAADCELLLGDPLATELGLTIAKTVQNTDKAIAAKIRALSPASAAPSKAKASEADQIIREFLINEECGCAKGVYPHPCPRCQVTIDEAQDYLNGPDQIAALTAQAKEPK